MPGRIPRTVLQLRKCGREHRLRQAIQIVRERTRLLRWQLRPFRTKCREHVRPRHSRSRSRSRSRRRQRRQGSNRTAEGPLQTEEVGARRFPGIPLRHRLGDIKSTLRRLRSISTLPVACAAST